MQISWYWPTKMTMSPWLIAIARRHTGMLASLVYFILMLYTLGLNRLHRIHNAWTFFGSDGSAKTRVIVQASELNDYLALGLYLATMTEHLAFLIPRK